MKRYPLWASVAPFALIATQAWGQAATPQDQQAAAAPDTTVEAQAPAAQGQATGAAAGRSPGTKASRNSSNTDDQDSIVITGVRQSLATAAAIKRNSDSILDAVVAQDIGKLPDDTAAETLARIAGVQVQRYADEVNGILIRGLPDVATSYNGREIFTAELRGVQLQDFPAQALAGIEIYKSGTADLIEPGLAGLVNVRTRRPFDFKGLEVAGGVRGTYNDQSRLFDPQGNILVSNRWETGIGEIGLLVNATYAQSRYHNAIRYNGTNVTDTSPRSIITPNIGDRRLRHPYSVGLFNPSGKRYRPSGNFALQWQPNNDLEFYVEGIYQGYRGQGVVDNFDVDLRGNAPVQPGQTLGTAPTLSDVVLVDGTTQIKSMTKSGGYRPQAYRSTTKDATNTYQIAGGGKWTTGIATLSTDFAYSTSSYRNRQYSIDSAMTSAPTVKVDFIHDNGVAFSMPDYDFSNPANYVWRGYYENDKKVSGKGLQWRGDVVLDLGNSLLRKLQFGYRITSRNADSKYGDRYAYTESLKIPFASIPIGELKMSPNPFRGKAQGFTSYLVPSYSGVQDNQAKLRQLTRESSTKLIALDPTDANLKVTQKRFESETVQFNPDSAFHADEQSYAAYLQGKYGFDIGTVLVDGSIGLRGVITHGRYSGTSAVTQDGVTTSVFSKTDQDYLDLLPNASMRVKFTDKLQLRLGYTYTRTRPSFGDLNPALFISQVVRDPSTPIDPSNPESQVQAEGSGGNPNLRPLTSHNYDASLEYYFSKSGFVSAAIFYRDLDGFIGSFTRYYRDPTYGLLKISRPENSGQGKIKGAEANFQSFLDFLPDPLNGFGIQANVTYLDGKNRTPEYDTATDVFSFGDFVKITGLSDWTYNAALFYEKEGVTTRLSYNRRSAYVRSYGTDILNRKTTWNTKPISRLDFSFSYDITKQFTISADATNLLAKPFNNFSTDYYGYQYAQDVRDEGRYFGFGARFRFGN